MYTNVILLSRKYENVQQLFVELVRLNNRGLFVVYLHARARAVYSPTQLSAKHTLLLGLIRQRPTTRLHNPVLH